MLKIDLNTHPQKAFDHTQNNVLNLSPILKTTVNMHTTMSPDRIYRLDRQIPGITDTVDRMMKKLVASRAATPITHCDELSRNIALDFYSQPNIQIEKSTDTDQDHEHYLYSLHGRQTIGDTVPEICREL